MVQDPHPSSVSQISSASPSPRPAYIWGDVAKQGPLSLLCMVTPALSWEGEEG